MKNLFNSEKASIDFNPFTNAIELTWKNYADEASYKQMFSKGLEFIQEYEANAWLSDIRKEGFVSPEHTYWLQTEIIPKAISLGLKKIAIVMDGDIYQDFYIKNIDSEIQKNGKRMLAYFDSTEEANEWLALSSD